MKFVFATPVLANFALALIPTQRPSQQICSQAWNTACSAPMEKFMGKFDDSQMTCGERIQYVHDYKLGVAPTVSAAVAKVLKHCPSDCQEFANNQCDTFVEETLETPDCEATWNAVCTSSKTCGDKVIENQNRVDNLVLATLWAKRYDCGSACQDINNVQCIDTVNTKMNMQVQELQTPDATCQEAWDRTCSGQWVYESYTCGERINFVYEHRLGDQRTSSDAVNRVVGECPNLCKEFKDNKSKIEALSQKKLGSALDMLEGLVRAQTDKIENKDAGNFAFSLFHSFIDGVKKQKVVNMNAKAENEAVKWIAKGQQKVIEIAGEKKVFQNLQKTLKKATNKVEGKNKSV